jgi:photosystem II stability/assembly factor-like uncharacterized protein
MRLHLLPVAFSALLWGASAKKEKPSVSTSKFPFWPSNIQYFDDSDVLLFQDINAGTLYRSEDAGVEWKKVSEVPTGDLVEMIMHPFDNKRAFAIMNGHVHLKTKNRGESWEEFETESQASAFREALTFHAGDPDRILFNGMDCASIFCEEVVSLGKALSDRFG